MTNYAPEVEYFVCPHCDNCDTNFVEGIGVVPVITLHGEEQWCTMCCDAEGIEYNEGTL